MNNNGVQPAPIIGRAVTAGGRAAICAIELSGSGIRDFLAQHLCDANGKTVDAPVSMKFKRCRWRQDDRIVEELIVACLGTKDDTGTEFFHLFGHGSRATPEMIRHAVAAASGTWLQTNPPAATPENADRTAWELNFESVLSNVVTPLQVQVALESRHAVMKAFQQYGSPAAWPEAWIRNFLQGHAARSILMKTHVVVLWGPANAGKSTLLNTLVRDHRSLAGPVPGTTREPVSADMDLDGLAVRWLDAAGQKEAVDDVEKNAMTQSEQARAAADLSVWLSPADSPCPPPANGPAILTCTAKADQIQGIRPAGICISSVTGEGIPELNREIFRILTGNSDWNDLQPGSCSDWQLAVLKDLLL